ncbi:hypothetical protein BJ508DRAFT_310586 [Ascobolus immersus RN42]|uniref:Uncharacterized protein n=1 Tax=Ascobolus immersus RN42 TaxID=1160509 RepID=A0A3N4HV49_ASCIM|nr:hypothetical protein BJ508DRAFT_310586 [Ascobolus immersus RN42]
MDLAQLDNGGRVHQLLDRFPGNDTEEEAWISAPKPPAPSTARGAAASTKNPATIPFVAAQTSTSIADVRNQLVAARLKQKEFQQSLLRQSSQMITTEGRVQTLHEEAVLRDRYMEQLASTIDEQQQFAEQMHDTQLWTVESVEVLHTNQQTYQNEIDELRQLIETLNGQVRDLVRHNQESDQNATVLGTQLTQNRTDQAFNAERIDRLHRINNVVVWGYAETEESPEKDMMNLFNEIAFPINIKDFYVRKMFQFNGDTRHIITFKGGPVIVNDALRCYKLRNRHYRSTGKGRLPFGLDKDKNILQVRIDRLTQYKVSYLREAEGKDYRRLENGLM